MSIVVITGFAPDFSEHLASLFLEKGHVVIGLSRHQEAAKSFQKSQPDFIHYVCDISDTDSVTSTFSTIRLNHGDPGILIHNAGQIHIGDFLETRPEDFSTLWKTMCLGAVNVCHQVLPAMLEAGMGTILFSGATASIKGGANFSAFASAKFALRGLAQSLARAYSTKGIHVLHAIIDGIIWSHKAEHKFKMDKAKCIDPKDLARIYYQAIKQPSSAWTHEFDVRPAVENF